MKIFKFFIVFFILICWSNCNSNKSNPTINSNYGNIQGKIRNALTDSMIVGAIINTNPPTSQVTSDSKGEYSIENIEAKSYIVSANKSGYISNSTNIEVFAGKVAKADISLTPAVSNSPPSIPHVVAPLDNSTVQTNSVTLSWSCTDPDNDPLKYDVYLSKTNPPTNIISSNQSAKSMTCCSLDSSTVYYWKVVAKDNKGGITSGNVWNFKTGRYSIPTFGLVAYYPFNSNANDESGNNFNGTVFGATLTTDRFGNTNRAYNFDGYDDEIQVIHAEALNIIGDISLSAWFNSIEAPLFRTCHTILIKRSQTSSLSFPYAISINYQY